MTPRKPVTDWTTDWDHLDPRWREDPYPIWDELRRSCPIAHTERYQGAYLPTRYEDVRAIANDSTHFSSRRVIVREVRPEPIPSPPITSDPPHHKPYKQLRDAPLRAGEGQQRRRAAKRDEHAMQLRADRHREVPSQADGRDRGVVAELDAADRREILAVQQAHRAVARIGDVHRIARGLIEDALRLAEPVYGPQGAARREIDHTQAVVAEFGDKQALPPEIYGDVIDPAAYRPEWDLRLKHQRRASRLCKARGGCEKSRQGQ